MRSRRLVALAVTMGAAVALLLTACGSKSDEAVGDGLRGVQSSFEGNDGRLKVATTVAPLTSIVLNVGGDRIRIHQLIPDGVDSHTFEPKPSDAKVLSRADLLIMNGAHLEGTTEKIAKQNLPHPEKIYYLADNTLQGDDERSGFLYDFSFPRSEGDPNPHLWMNPLYALRYAELTAQWLGENDPDNRDYYQQNLARFADVLKRIDAAIQQDQASVPQQNRRLLTYHDSWAYWARRYGWTVIGAAQPSDFKEPSAQEVGNLVAQIKKEGVPAVFGSEVFPSKTLESIARETGAKFEDRLRDDEPPGAAGDAQHTYVGMLVEDMRIMLTALGGNADETSKIPVANTFERGRSSS
ncbi:MAG TPA: metal ABC transporter substrate-binding protein [Dehalococcoidia bacterium]|nr:metal ABC transporter substrate-binding protein [Dehalococcoidia bacterium]